MTLPTILDVETSPETDGCVSGKMQARRTLSRLDLPTCPPKNRRRVEPVNIYVVATTIEQV
jgi:hypothetical protein